MNLEALNLRAGNIDFSKTYVRIEETSNQIVYAQTDQYFAGRQAKEILALVQTIGPENLAMMTDTGFYVSQDLQGRIQHDHKDVAIQGKINLVFQEGKPKVHPESDRRFSPTTHTIVPFASVEAMTDAQQEALQTQFTQLAADIASQLEQATANVNLRQLTTHEKRGKAQSSSTLETPSMVNAQKQFVRESARRLESERARGKEQRKKDAIRQEEANKKERKQKKEERHIQKEQIRLKAIRVKDDKEKSEGKR